VLRARADRVVRATGSGAWELSHCTAACLRGQLRCGLEERQAHGWLSASSFARKGVGVQEQRDRARVTWSPDTTELENAVRLLPLARQGVSADAWPDTAREALTPGSSLSKCRSSWFASLVYWLLAPLYVRQFDATVAGCQLCSKRCIAAARTEPHVGGEILDGGICVVLQLRLHRAEVCEAKCVSTARAAQHFAAHPSDAG
jgi:hypothetical protein